MFQINQLIKKIKIEKEFVYNEKIYYIIYNGNSNPSPSNDRINYVIKE